MKKLSKDVDDQTAKRKQLINPFNTLKTSCGSVKGDTKDKGFDEISTNAKMYVALNDFEKT